MMIIKAVKRENFSLTHTVTPNLNRMVLSILIPCPLWAQKKPPAPSAAALRRKLHKYIQKAREEGEDELDVVVDELIKQERKQAKLEYQLSAKRPG